MTAPSSSSELKADASPWQGLGRALALALAPLVALGFSRFAYALLLPAMQAGLGWNLAQAGALNTANGVGYLVGAVAAAPAARRWGAAWVFSLSMAVSALALLLSGLPHGWPAFMVLRAAGGVSTAAAFVLGTALATQAMPQRPASALALYFAGSGVGMVLAGSVLPYWLESSADGWRIAWVLMGIGAALAAWIATAAARKLPAAERATTERHPAGGLRPLWPSLAANVLYGAGYVGYTTFVIALLRQQGHGSLAASAFFCALGLASLLASPAWGQGLERMRVGRGFALVCACVALGTLPVLLSSALPWLARSALTFGASFMAGPAAVSLAAHRVLPPSLLATGLGALTAAFSLGQSIGPLAAGWIADATGRLEAGLWLGPIILLAAAAVSLKQRPAPN